MPTPEPVVCLRAVEKLVHEGGAARAVLSGVDLEVGPGEAVALLGRSGSGKSTLLNLIAGIDEPDGGQVVTAGLDVTSADERARAALRTRSLGFVFQSFHLLPTLTVAENVALPLELAGLAASESRARVAELLQRVGLADRAGAWPRVLSGGEQQRVAVARALASRPRLLLCDEPTGNLDDAAAALVLDLISQLRAEQGCAVVLVTHSRAAAAICDRQLRLEGGQLRAVEEAATENA
ncbi:MAG: ABC transporter ATP-binding protein [Planctomycetota bacterium]|nr:ABC transporter ATP-binding protein [Planctomycetota bacterium]